MNNSEYDYLYVLKATETTPFFDSDVTIVNTILKNYKNGFKIIKELDFGTVVLLIFEKSKTIAEIWLHDRTE